ncbi:MAG TPA: glutaredoxin [Elusimicrobia bacterium]|nr:glutaredoxin [Elusimicrobiota bacterium]
MSVLDDKVKSSVKKDLSNLKNNVKLILFSQEIECPSCKDASSLAEEVAALTDKISVEKYDFVLNKAQTEHYKIDKIPAIAVVGVKDFGIRFYGVPGGFEFSSFIDAIKLVSSGDSGLAQKTKEELSKITKSVLIKIFVTLTCPYCSSAVKLANRFAIENDLVLSEMVVATEFPHLTHKYNVFSVPKVVINETVEFEGALPEEKFLEQILKA